MTTVVVRLHGWKIWRQAIPKITAKGEIKELKWEWNFPDDFILIIDTREQQPLFKRPPKGLLTVRDKLDVGDYSIRGFESYITVERKNLFDFLSSITSGHAEFAQRLEKMKGYERRYLLIEATERELLSFAPSTSYARINPNVIRGNLASIWGKHYIPIYYAETRKDAERWILDTLLRFFRYKRSPT